MRDRGYKSMRAMEDAYTATAHKNRYHPVKLYLDALRYFPREDELRYWAGYAPT